MRKVSRRDALKASGIGIVALAGCLGDGDDGTGDDGGDDGTGDDGGDDGTGDGGDDGTGDGGDDGTTEPTDDPIIVGNLVPDPIPQGENQRRAMELGVDWINENGGLMGRELELREGITELETDTAISEAQRLIQQENVDVLIGGFQSEVVLGVQQEVTADTGVIFMPSSAGTQILNQRVAENYDRFRNYFTNVPRSPQVFDGVAFSYENAIVPDTGLDHAVVMAEELTYTEGMAERIDEQTADDITIDSIRFDFQTEDFSPLLNEAVNTGADVALMAMAVAPADVFINQWAQSETPLLLSGIAPPAASPAFPDQVGADVARTVGVDELGSRAPITDLTIDFYDTYESRNDVGPDTTAWLAFDALWSWKSAVEDAGSLDLDDLVSTMEEISVEGASGTLNFQGPDDTFPHGPVFDPEDGIFYTGTQWQEVDGELTRVLLSPDEWADFDGEQEYILPPWME